MPYFLTYRMTVGHGMSTCFTPRDAVTRHGQLLLAGAADVAICHNGDLMSLAEVEALVFANRTCVRPL